MSINQNLWCFSSLVDTSNSDSIGQFFEKEIFALSGINKTTMTILDFITAISNATKIQFFKGSYDNNGVLDVATVNDSTFPELIYEVNFSNFNVVINNISYL